MAFAAAEVEDGTGLATALVFEQSAAAATWLSHAARDLTAFSTATAAAQDKGLLKATSFVLSWLTGRLDGKRLVSTQALAYPRVGSTSRAGQTFESDAIPPKLLEAIRLMAEVEVSTGIVLRDNAADIKSGRQGGATVVFRSAAGSASSRYPEAWALAQSLFNPSRRLWRAA